MVKRTTILMDSDLLERLDRFAARTGVTKTSVIAAALEAHLSVVSNTLNEVVLKVSAWAAIIALPTVIASIYGMNFSRMPELHWHLGYPYALTLMACSGLALYALFRRHHWL